MIAKIGRRKMNFNRKPMVFLCDIANRIIGINYNCYTYLKLTLNLIEHSFTFSLTDIFPHFEDDDFENKLIRDVGTIFSFNIRNLPSDIICQRIEIDKTTDRKILLWGKMESFMAENEEAGLLNMKILTLVWISTEQEIDKLNKLIYGNYLRREKKKRNP